MRTSNRVQPAFYTRVQPTSEGGLNSHLSEFEVLEKMADRGRMWTDAEIALLLNVWSEDSIQRQLQGALRNEVPYKKIAAELEKAGYSRSFKQCREKIKALKKRYKEIADRQRKSGVGVESDEDLSVPDFKWFEDLHRVMKGRAVVSPVHLLDSTNPGDLLTPAASGVPREDDDNEEGVPLEIQTYHSEESAPLDTNTTSSSHTAETLSGSRTATPTPSGSRTATPTPSGSRTATPTPSGSRTATPTPGAEGPPKKKRKKITKVERAEKAANEILERVLKEQQVLAKRQEELELERRRWEEKKAESESERDTKFIEMLGQLISVIRPQQGPHAFATPYPPPPQYPPVPPMPRPPPQQAPVSFDPYDPMYMYPAPDSEEEEED